MGSPELYTFFSQCMLFSHSVFCAYHCNISKSGRSVYSSRHWYILWTDDSGIHHYGSHQLVLSIWKCTIYHNSQDEYNHELLTCIISLLYETLTNVFAYPNSPQPLVLIFPSQSLHSHRSESWQTLTLLNCVMVFQISHNYFLNDALQHFTNDRCLIN